VSHLDQGSKWIRPERRAAIYARDRFACVYCGRSCGDDPDLRLSLDHVEARSNGGFNASENLVTACVSCNASKGRLGLDDFVAGLALRLGVDDREIRARVRRAARRKVPGGLDGRKSNRGDSRPEARP